MVGLSQNSFGNRKGGPDAAAAQISWALPVSGFFALHICLSLSQRSWDLLAINLPQLIGFDSGSFVVSCGSRSNSIRHNLRPSYAKRSPSSVSEAATGRLDGCNGIGGGK